MDVDEIQRQVSKFQRVSSNGSTTTTDTSQKLATNFDLQNTVDDGNGGGEGGGGRGIDVVGGGGGGVARLCGWPASRIVRVSRASGGKDRHSKVLTSKGLRDRRVRLSVSTAIQFYDLQDRLGYDQPSKAVEWLLKAASSSIDELPSLDPSFSGVISENHKNYMNHQAEERKLVKSIDFEDPRSTNDILKSPGGSSTSETSKGSGLSLSRSENRIKARKRARELASKKDKEKEIVLNPVINIAENSSFTDLLTCGINTTNSNTSTPVRRSNPMDYFFARSQSYPNQFIQIPQFNITTGDHNHNNNNHHHHNNQQHQFSFLQDNFATNTSGGGGGEGESYNLNFSMTSSSGGGGGVTAAAALAPGFSRGTLQSNLPSSILPHHQRFQSSSIDGSNATNLPFFFVPNNVSDYFPGGYHLSYGNGGENNHKEKTKN